jgi:hypothetical protein
LGFFSWLICRVFLSKNPILGLTLVFTALIFILEISGLREMWQSFTAKNQEAIGWLLKALLAAGTFIIWLVKISTVSLLFGGILVIALWWFVTRIRGIEAPFSFVSFLDNTMVMVMAAGMVNGLYAR